MFLSLQEIHYDRIGGRDAAKLVNADLPDVIEIWNNVFIQYNREADGSLRPLPAQHVDTGMGFERLTSILQNVDSNYDTDIFLPLFAAIQRETGSRPYQGKIGKEDPEFIDMAYRVVADHIRTLCFAIADGATPSNDGRGYVLRRVLRRAVRYGRQNLNAELGFFSKLVPTLIELMGDVFPELKEKELRVTQVIREEEESFSRTIDKGLQKFQELAEKCTDGVFPGEDAHYLYTTMGFPFDLTELMAEERGLKVDVAGFEARMKQEQELSAAAHLAKMAGDSGKDMRMVAEQTAHLVSKNVPSTDDSPKYVWNQPLENCKVEALFLGRNETEDKIGFVDVITPESSTIGVILNQTSFYAEQGGQINDTGFLKTASGSVVKVQNVQLYGKFVLHIGVVEQGTVSVNDSVTCEVDYVRRQPIASNHTMTHVLNHALRAVLVNDESMTVEQKGSLVDETKLRFDFSWNGGLTPEQLKKVEEHCVSFIDRKVPVDCYVAPLPDAEKISSLRAVFGEKYPDPVRVVAVADQPVTDMLANPQDAVWNEYSVEFCGGTHLTNTSEAEAFVLLSEEGIAKGVRRIVGVTMDDAKKCMALADSFADKLRNAETLQGDVLEPAVKVLSTELDGLTISAIRKIEFREKLQELSKAVVAYKKQKVAGMADEIVNQAVALAGTTEGSKVVLRVDLAMDGKTAKSVAQAFGKKVTDKALMLIAVDVDKFSVVAFSPKGVVDCQKWVAAVTEGTGGKGGGKADFAQTQVGDLKFVDQVEQKAKSE
jgi:alanyl-tRNA synthetase